VSNNLDGCIGIRALDQLFETMNVPHAMLGSLKTGLTAPQWTCNHLASLAGAFGHRPRMMGMDEMSNGGRALA
jgi:hypothetical protein